MEISENKLADDAIVLGLTGRLDPTTVAQVEERLGKIIEGGAQRIVLDLAGLDYISSAGLRVVLMGAKRVQLAGGKLVLCAAQSHVKEVLTISGFSSILTIVDTQEEAVASLG